MAKLYRDFDQAALDKQYSPSQWVTRCTAMDAIYGHVARLEEGTAAACKSVPSHEKNVPYSDTDPVCTLDLFHPQSMTPTTPLLVYIHGGYWCAGILEKSGGWFAHTVVDHGCSLATVEYGLCGATSVVDGVAYSLDSAAQHVRLAIAFLRRRYPSRPLHITGHSAGGQLCAMLLATDWTHPEFQLPPGAQPISSALLVSGVFDLEPIRLSCVNEESTLGLKLDGGVEMVRRNSPALLLDQTAQNCTAGRIKVVVAVGGQDSPEFIRQSREFHETLLRHAVDSALLVVAREDHFSVVEQLDSPQDALAQRLLTLIGCSEEDSSNL